QARRDAKRSTELDYRREGILRGQKAPDQLTAGLNSNWIHEVHAHEFLRQRVRTGEPCDRNGGGVGHEKLPIADLRQRRNELFFCLFFFHDCFYHDVTVREGMAVDCGLDTGCGLLLSLSGVP